MSDSWYCLTEGGTLGPLPLDELRALARSGQVPLSSPAWREGASPAPLESVPGFITEPDPPANSPTASGVRRSSDLASPGFAGTNEKSPPTDPDPEMSQHTSKPSHMWLGLGLVVLLLGGFWVGWSLSRRDRAAISPNATATLRYWTDLRSTVMEALQKAKTRQSFLDVANDHDALASRVTHLELHGVEPDLALLAVDVAAYSTAPVPSPRRLCGASSATHSAR